MATVWVISDTHFGHENILKFTNNAGVLMRPGFKDADEMDEYIVYRWNSVVRPIDHVYHLGDVVMNANNLHILQRLNGHKRLILGNHDEPHMRLYSPYFEKIYGSRLLEGMLMTHIPIHPASLYKEKINVHGHVHNNVPQGHFGPKHYNVSIEMLDDYTPITLEDLRDRVKKFQESY